MAIRFGVSPIAWVNDDMPELGGGTPLESILQDVRLIGFEGVELGGTFPRDPKTLKALLDPYGLDLVGGWFSGSLLVHDVEAEIVAARSHVDLLKAMGSKVFIYAETSNAIHGRKAVPLSQSPMLDQTGWRIFGDRLTQFAEFIQGQGLRFAYHHHLGTVVERPVDLDALVKHTSTSVGFTLDTGHASLAGVDPVATIRAYPSRIAHVHCKDVRREVFSALQKRDQSFLNGVLAGMFTVPGDGAIDYALVMQALAEIGYSGWIVVEAEQDPAIADPRIYGELGLRTLEREAASAGLIRAA